MLITVAMLVTLLPVSVFATDPVSFDAYIFKHGATSSTISTISPDSSGLVVLDISPDLPQSAGVTTVSAIKSMTLYWEDATATNTCMNILIQDGKLQDAAAVDDTFFFTNLTMYYGYYTSDGYFHSMAVEGFWNNPFCVRIETYSGAVYMSSQTLTVTKPVSDDKFIPYDPESGQQDPDPYQGGQDPEPLPASTPPAITTTELPGAQVGEAYSFTFAATPAAEGDQVIWGLGDTGSIPSGLVLSAEGVLSGTPAEAGDYTFTVIASETGESIGQASQSFALSVEEAPPVELELDGTPDIYLSYAYGGNVETLVREGEFSCFILMNRTALEGELIDCTINYTNTDGSPAQTSLIMTVPDGCYYAYLNNTLPGDAAVIGSFVFSINDAEVYSQDFDLPVAPELDLTFTGDGADSAYLYIYDSNENVVFSSWVSKDDTFEITSLPAGSYDIEVSGWVSSYGYMELYTGSVDISSGTVTTRTITVLSHTVTYVEASVREGSDSAWAYDGFWYSDQACTDLVRTGSYAYLLDDETLYFKAVPYYYTSVYYTGSDPMAVNKDSGSEGEYGRTFTYPLTPKATITVTGKAQFKQLKGSGYYTDEYYVSVVRSGKDGFTSSESKWVPRNGNEPGSFTIDRITEGTVVTVNGRSGYHGSVSHTVTAAEIANGALDLGLIDVPLADGMIALDIKKLESDGTRNANIYFANELTVKKSDGSNVPFRKFDSSLLLEPGYVNSGDVLTISAKHYWDAAFPEYVGETTVTMGTSDGRLYGSAQLEMLHRGYISARWTHNVSYPFVALLYNSAGSLIYTNRNAVGNNSLSSVLTFPNVDAGSYTVAFVNKSYLDSLDPADYDTAAEAKALQYSACKDVTVADKENVRAELTLPDDAPPTGRVNIEASGMSMSRQYSGLVTLDMTVIPSEDFNPQGDVTLIINTNQTGQNPIGWGYVNTRTFTINGKVYDLNRFSDFTHGIIDENGVITLKLSQEEIEKFGGFPMTISTSFVETVSSSISAQAYLKYSQGNEGCYNYIASYAEETGHLTLEAPQSVADLSFTVYGKGPASLGEKPYYVTIYADGVPVAKTSTDLKKGWYKAKIELDPDAYENHQTIEFTASGAYGDGGSAYQSPAASCDYTPNEGALRKIDLLWQYAEYVNVMSRITLLDDGDPVNLYKAWYRGGHVNDEGKVQWQIWFDNSDKVEAVYVHVPRNGFVIDLEAKDQGDGSWLTDPEYFPGAAPDGAWVTFDTTPVYEIERREPVVIDYSDASRVLNKTPYIAAMTGTPDSADGLSFNLKNSKGAGDIAPKGLDVNMKYVDVAWDDEEFADLKALQPVFSDMPNIVSYEEGFLQISDGAWAHDLITRFDDPDHAGKLIFERDTYTAYSRTITIWDEYTRTISKSVLTIGGEDNFGNPPIEEGLTGTAEELAYTDALHQIWSAFYDQIADAAVELAGMTEEDLQLNMGRKVDLGKALEKTKELADDSYSWAEGAEIRKDEIVKIFNFLKSNQCLYDTLKMARSASDKTDYDVFGEVNAVYYKIGLGCIGKICDIAFGAPNYLGKSAQEAGKEAIKAIKDGAKNYMDDYLKGKIFYRQAENLAHEVYLAAKKAEREGLCFGNVDWSKFPKDLYDPDKDFGKRPTKTPAEPQGRYDPSGFIYEAVPSNRLEGATVTLYQLDGETYSGSVLSGGTAVMTDAEYFGLEPNPQVTGEDGRYQWFVPEGWWRVKVSLDGYGDADSGSSAAYGLGAVQNQTDGYYYMPVLPVQLDVNIPLVSYEAPAVDSFEATTEGVLVTFTKYMDETTLVPAAFKLLVDGADKAFGTDASLSFVDSEASSDAGAAPTYSRTVLISYNGAAAGDKVQLVIANSVKSYAGTPMASRYDSGEQTVVEAPQTAAPTASAAAGEVALNTAVKLSCATTGASIYYTTDGTDPTTASAVYDNALIISQDMTAKAIAVRAGMTPSEIITAA